mgnify:CR=1 FL=1
MPDNQLPLSLVTGATSGIGRAVVEALLTLLGSLMLAVPISLLGYAVALWVWREFHYLRDG